MTMTHDEYFLDYLFPSNAEVCVFIQNITFILYMGNGQANYRS